MRIGPYLLEVDAKRTNEYYQLLTLMTKSCSCDDCRNYVQACLQFPTEINEFFRAMGIDPRKEGEVFVLDDTNDSVRLYQGFYHVVGRIIEGPINEEFTSVLASHPYQLSVGFTNDLDLLPDNFPEPAIQLGFEMNVPWVIN